MGVDKAMFHLCKQHTFYTESDTEQFLTNVQLIRQI